MSVVQRGMRSSTRSKAVAARIRDFATVDGPKGPMPTTGRRMPPRAQGGAPAGSVFDLTEDQQAAAEHLAEVFAAAEFEAWARGGPGAESGACDPLTPSPEALVARAAYRGAMRAVPVLLSPLVVHVCCLGLPLALWADEKRLPLGRAEAGLRMALNHLATHFRGVAWL